MGFGRLIRVGSWRGDPEAAIYVVADADPTKAIDIIKVGGTADDGNDFEDLGRQAPGAGVDRAWGQAAPGGRKGQTSNPGGHPTHYRTNSPHDVAAGKFLGRPNRWPVMSIILLIEATPRGSLVGSRAWPPRRLSGRSSRVVIAISPRELAFVSPPLFGRGPITRPRLAHCRKPARRSNRAC
jgi:hypothetical protein